MQRLICLLFFFILLIKIHSQNISIEINWQNPKTILSINGEDLKCLYFENAAYDDDPILPVYYKEIGVFSEDFENIQLIATIKNEQYIALTDEEETILLNSQRSFETQIKPSIVYFTEKKQRKALLKILPLRYNLQTQKVEKLRSASVEIKAEFLPSKTSKKTKTQPENSVLANGKFYKISVAQPGVYRIGYKELEEMGIDVARINPQNIKLFGNGGQMLPESNADERPYDLVENAIFVAGENDNKFDETDYILFYAPGPHSVYYSKSRKMFFKSLNKYSDKSYYFLTISNTPGKRIKQLDLSDKTPSIQTSIFQDYLHYENDEYNLIKSGKEWYGDVFDFNTVQDFEFLLPGVVKDSCTKIFVEMIARSPGISSARLICNASSATLNFQPTTSYTGDYAKTNSTLMCVNSTEKIKLTIDYNKQGFSDAKAWLNFIMINAWKNLAFTSTQMHFQHPEMWVDDFVSYSISTGSNITVWDITNPLEPQVVKGKLSGGKYIFNVFGNDSRYFVAFNSDLYLQPQFVGEVKNQNLHSLKAIDYVIISHPDFVGEAKRLGEFHKKEDNLSYIVVTPEEIYNEFSSGSQDPTAIRDFMKMLYDRATTKEEMPKYLLLFGRASYDYKNRKKNNTNFIPTFQSKESLALTKSFASDDYFGILDDSEGEDCEGHLDIAVGRLPVSTIQEAKQMVDKIIRYHGKTNSSTLQNACQYVSNVPNLSDWRNCITFVADDGDNNLHFNQAEGLANFVSNQNPILNIDKIYLDAYPQVSTTGGERAPRVNEAINRKMSQGCLIMNYTGHGGEVGWSHERILELVDIKSWTNHYAMPLFITATCEFSRFDDPERIAAGELVLLNSVGGGIALFSTTRIAFSNYNENLNRSVYKIAFRKINNKYPTIGEIFSFSKTDNNSSIYIKNFILLGDPALRLAYPNYNIKTTSINQKSVLSEVLDTLNALSLVTIEGVVCDDNNNVISDFNGILTPTIYDKPRNYKTLASDPSVNSPASFKIQNSIIYKGKVEVKNGRFGFSFIVPKDINYSYGNGKISYYAENGVTDASGYFVDFVIGGSSKNTINDDKGPEIRLFINDTTFVDGGVTNENPILIAYLEDSSGINTTGNGVGHDIIAILDDDNNLHVLNSFYESDLNSYQKGKVIYPFYNLPEGEHTILFKAWDILNNSSTAKINFVVAKSNEPLIKNLFNFPNPFSDYTSFVFSHNQSCSELCIELEVFDLKGQKVYYAKHTQTSNGYTIEPIEWDGTNSQGAMLRSGVYTYQVTLSTCDGKKSKATSKLVIIR